MADLKELLFIQQEALYLYLSLSFFLCFLHPQNKQKERILLTPACLQERREKNEILGRKK